MKTISVFTFLAWTHSTVCPPFSHSEINGCSGRDFSTKVIEIKGSDTFSVLNGSELSGGWGCCYESNHKVALGAQQ